jgi:hypothetical protein
MSHHLDPVPDVPENEIDWFDDVQEPSPRRPAWWRWVVVVVVVAMVVATPFIYALYRLLQ